MSSDVMTWEQAVQKEFERLKVDEKSIGVEDCILVWTEDGGYLQFTQDANETFCIYFDRLSGFLEELKALENKDSIDSGSTINSVVELLKKYSNDI